MQFLEQIYREVDGILIAIYEALRYLLDIKCSNKHSLDPCFGLDPTIVLNLSFFTYNNSLHLVIMNKNVNGKRRLMMIAR